MGGQNQPVISKLGYETGPAVIYEGRRLKIQKKNQDMCSRSEERRSFVKAIKKKHQAGGARN